MPKKRKSNNWTPRRNKKRKQDELSTDPMCLDDEDKTEINDNFENPQKTTVEPAFLNILRGSWNQDNDRYSSLSRNHQCTAIAAVALAYNALVPFSSWNSIIIDNVLDYGDCLYNKSVSLRVSRNVDACENPDLMVIEVHPKFLIDLASYSLNIQEVDTVTGHVGLKCETPFFSLGDGLEQVFRNYQSAILTCTSLSTCISKSSSSYYLFDSHSRGKNGKHVEYGGTACLLSFCDVFSLLKFLLDTYESDALYTLVPITVKISSIYDLTDIDDYSVLTVYNAIPFSQKSSPNSESSKLDQYSTSKTKSRDMHMKLTEVTTHYLGKMDIVCPHCQALFFTNESMICCKKGTIQLPEKGVYPELLKSLITGLHPKSKEFIKYIRKYNALLALGSTVLPLRTDIKTRNVPLVVSGQIHHLMSNIDPLDIKFASLYLLDSTEAKKRREKIAIHIGCDPNLVEQLDALLRETHPFIRLYRSLGLVVEDLLKTGGSDAIPQVGLYFCEKPGTNRNVYAAPTSSDEIGAVFRSVEGDIPPPGQIRICCKETPSINIPKLSPITDPLCYPLLFPNGELGSSMDLVQSESSKTRKCISSREFDCYRLMSRFGQINPILLCGQLTQQYIIDKYIALEGNRLEFLRQSQEKLRVDNYVGVQDYLVRKRTSESNVKLGKIFILPSSFIGSPRFMRQNYHDAVAIMMKFGLPSLFITFTCNVEWPEIKENLGSTLLKEQDRPDLIARIFNLKKKAFFDDILKNKIFGKVIAYIYVIDFQKRGLPRLHCLLTLAESNKLKDADEVDKIICAELPSDNTRLLDIITATMIHGPCGNRNANAPCMVDGSCSKGYPKEFSETTVIDCHWPKYRRRNDGRTVLLKKHNISTLVDNRDVVPYNPYLSLKYGCHINIEFVTDLTMVKSILNYMYKKPDPAFLKIKNEYLFDEIKSFVDSRYISSGEAAWRLLGFSTQGKSNSVLRLPIHLPGEQAVQFKEGEEETALQIQENKISHLEAFFKLNAKYPDARLYKYSQIPLYYCFGPKNNCWSERRRLIPVLTRLYTVSPKYVEKFHLRLLLLHVAGPTSYEDLRTFEGITYPSFQEAARARHLIPSNDEWLKTLTHASLVDMPSCMRKLYAYLLCYCEVDDAYALWNFFKDSMSIDLRRIGYSDIQSENIALRRINTILRNLGKTLTEFNLPLPFPDVDDIDDENQDLKTGNFDPNMLNSDQRRIFDKVIQAAISEDSERCFYLQGSAGTGKTYLYNTLLNYCTEHGIPVIAVAVTGIAALQLKNGRTIHTTFKLPLDLDSFSHSGIQSQSQEADDLRKLKLIIWDEVSSTSYHVLNAVDRLLQDLCRDSRPFGGKCILLGGDIKQLLPVGTNKDQQLEQLFTNCTSWTHFHVLNLSVNMRTDKGVEDFADWLEKLGSGTINKTDISKDIVCLPDRCLTADVVEEVYYPIGHLTAERIASRAILCPKDEHCKMLNDKSFQYMSGSLITILSSDSVASEDEDEIANFPVEYLNSCTPSGMPFHELHLKIGVPVILLRNLSLTDGLVEGTRLLVVAVTDVLLTAKIITGRFAGRVVFIPKVVFISTDKNIPFILKRRQFPVRLGFAITIDKSQGQTFDQIGIYLESEVFSHGQLYVAFSRARNWDAVKIEVLETEHQDKFPKESGGTFTKNIVFKDVLNSIR